MHYHRTTFFLLPKKSIFYIKSNNAYTKAIKLSDSEYVILSSDTNAVEQAGDDQAEVYTIDYLQELERAISNINLDSPDVLYDAITNYLDDVKVDKNFLSLLRSEKRTCKFLGLVLNNNEIYQRLIQKTNFRNIWLVVKLGDIIIHCTSNTKKSNNQ